MYVCVCVCKLAIFFGSVGLFIFMSPTEYIAYFLIFIQEPNTKLQL